MLVECYDKKGAEVYEIIIKQIFQDLVLGAAVDDLKAYVNPDDPVFILAIKMKKTSTVVEFGDVANFTYDKADDVTRILIDDENYLPNILNKLWRMFSRDEIYQPNRYMLELSGNQMDLENLVIDDPHSNLQRRIYDAIFRILPEGFKIIKDISTKDIVAVVATDELIMDAWVEKANEYIAELNNGM
ncbi:MAG: methanogenesis marker 17 protein [Methanobrevibacter sp.]|uniref:Methanogenesis marker 17 protein n=1 Tax=Methanobrevibacter millerae TaxID=230361 RepID=A0A8T3VRQ2_9EURY|nr:methanogenesis marker 17 protein [Methanobrevibacter sp.]MBE6510736.1 methanogenesis marker 17 protein [Methanobrevibacter millerae]MBO5152493.1 methanogenesis marker 17 protein [Methanobrevibacter sp.]